MRQPQAKGLLGRKGALRSPTLWVMPMEADDPITVVIAALNSFEPSRDDTDNLYRLYQLFEGFSSLPDRDRVAPAMFGLLERFPDAEFGSPGPLVHELEAIPGYLPLLRDSVRRQPTHLTVWMVNRLLNTKLPSEQRKSWLSELRAALEHPLASEQTRRFAEDSLEHQKDRLSELLDIAQGGRLTPEESEELARMLNAPVMAPAGHAVAGFVSKHTFEPSDLSARIKAIRWFSKCGEPVALDLTMEIESVRSWPAAMQECQGVAWEKIELAAQNQLTMWLHRNSSDRYRVWNDIVDQHKRELIAPLVKEKIVPFQLEQGLDVAIVHSTSWDVLGALMENSYLDTHHPVHFFLELLWVYEAGHSPCGWLGDWPSGKLIVF